MSAANRLMLWLLASLCYAALVVFTRHIYRHENAVFLSQYLILLPLLLFVLRAPTTSARQRWNGNFHGCQWILACFLVAVVAVGWFAGQTVLIPDEAAYLFQAETYSLGKLAGEAPPGLPAHPRPYPTELYFQHHVISGPTWYSKYPPGWPLLMTAFLELHADWLAGPVCGILTLLITGAIARRVDPDNRIKHWAWVLAACSPFFLAQSVGRMSHAACGFLITAAVWAFFYALARPNWQRFALMFAICVISCLTRPFSGFIAAVILGFGALWSTRSKPKLLAQVALIGATAGAVTIAATLYYNQLYTGSPWISPYAAARNVAVAQELTINPTRLLYVFVHITRWSVQKTFLTTVPFMLIVAAWVAWTEWSSFAVKILTLLTLVTMAGYALEPEFSFSITGERYYYEIFPLVCILAARGVVRSAERFAISTRTAVALGCGFAIMQASAFYVAWDAARKYGEPYYLVRKAAATLPPDRKLVFLRDSPHVLYLAQTMNLNRPDWRSRSRFFLVDTTSEKRTEWACRLGWRDWAVLGYDEFAHRATTEYGDTPATACLP